MLLLPLRRLHPLRARFIGPISCRSVSAESIGFPSGSFSHNLLVRCQEKAAAVSGTTPDGPYEPWLPTDLMQTLLVDVHDWAGCSWSLSIFVAVLCIRLVTLPVSVAAIKGSREKALINPQFDEIHARQQALKDSPEQLAKVNKEMQEFTQKHGRLWVLKGTWNLLLFQMPLYITSFTAMRGFASRPDLFPGFAMEGPLWLDSLALADPYCVMPVLTAGIMLTNVELFGSIDTEVQMMTQTKATPAKGKSTMQKYQKWIFRGSAVMFVPFTMNFPAATFLFMSTNMASASIQNRILRLPALERFLEIPPSADKMQAVSSVVPTKPAQFGRRPRSKRRAQDRETAQPQLSQAPLQIPLNVSRTATQNDRPERGRTKSSLQLPVINPQFAVKRQQPSRPWNQA